jgi:hypothetical protein
MGWELIANIRGPAGTAGGTRFTFVQSEPLATWTVTHNLGYEPQVTILMDDGTVVVADIDHTSLNTLVITFPTPYTGKAVCS